MPEDAAEWPHKCPGMNSALWELPHKTAPGWRLWSPWCLLLSPPGPVCDVGKMEGCGQEGAELASCCPSPTLLKPGQSP